MPSTFQVLFPLIFPTSFLSKKKSILLLSRASHSCILIPSLFSSSRMFHQLLSFFHPANQSVMPASLNSTYSSNHRPVCPCIHHQAYVWSSGPQPPHLPFIPQLLVIELPVLLLYWSFPVKSKKLPICQTQSSVLIQLSLLKWQHSQEVIPSGINSRNPAVSGLGAVGFHPITNSLTLSWITRLSCTSISSSLKWRMC